MEFLIGMIAGIVSGMGMGGGTVLILLLTFFSGIEQHVAQATNLIFFIPTSIAAILINAKEKLIDYKVTFIIGLTGIIGALIGAKISVGMDVKLLRKTFGIFLGLIAIHEIYSLAKEYIIKKKKT